MADALLFGQCVESRILGVVLPDPAKFPAGVQAALTRAMNNAELCSPIISSITEVLLREGRVTGAQMSGVAERAATGDRLGAAFGRRRLGDGEIRPASLARRRRHEKQLAVGRN
jgi:hypothetical protein